jgi:predicted MPP superfamily phosphohydrolase
MRVFKFFILVMLLLIFLWLQNNWIQVININFSSSKLHDNFNGYKILQISDLHSKNFGKNQNILISKVKNIKPDLIVITGDLIDIRTTDDKNVIGLISGIKSIAPIYFITGNHEIASDRFIYFEQNLKAEGVIILRNETVKLKRNNSFINLTGIDDSGFSTSGQDYNNYTLKVLSDELKKAVSNNATSTFSILLSHRPEALPLYAKYNVDLIFAGHAHGGQVRLPLIGGIFAPGQGYFPKYTNGVYNNHKSTMIVSRGLGNGSVPIRIFNRPEIIVTTLHSR